jgi:hypothetical protein
VGFEPTISAGERPQTYALDGAATAGTGILKKCLNINNIPAMEQYGFRENRSTEQAAYTLISGILEAWNSKSQFVGMFCDLAKAFGCMNHDILIEKLKYYGVNETGVD